MLPLSADHPRASQADITACRELLRGGSRSFFAASFLLPRAVRDPAVSLYAFCRVADDAIDLDNTGGTALARLRERLARVYEGRPAAIAADRALADVVARFAIPRRRCWKVSPGIPKGAVTRTSRRCMPIRRGWPAPSG